MNLQLTEAQVLLLIEALDSHEYWQLSDDTYRNDGSVRSQGSDDPESRREIQKVRRLVWRLESMLATRRGHCAEAEPAQRPGRLPD